jgi:hypothetical protein
MPTSPTRCAAVDGADRTLPSRLNAGVWLQVNTQTDRAEFHYGQFSVVRRYSDFVWLHTKLAHNFPVRP